MAISPTKEAILKALAHYKYLTVSHILQLGISINKKKTSAYFHELKKDFDFVDRQIHYGVQVQRTKGAGILRTRNEYLRHLTVKWAKFLDSYTDTALKDIRFPKKPKQYLSNDYFHRVSTISMHISFDKWMQESPNIDNRFLTYYNQNKASKEKRFESETRLQLKDGGHFSPDALCAYTTPNNQHQAFVLEVYNSNGNERTNYVIGQLEKLFWLIDKTRKVENRIGINAVPRILCTCSNERLLESVIARIKSNRLFWVKGIEQLLFFNLDTQIWSKFSKERVNIEGDKIDLETLTPLQ